MSTNLTVCSPGTNCHRLCNNLNSCHRFSGVHNRRPRNGSASSRRGNQGVNIRMQLHLLEAPPPLDFTCPTCSFIFPTRKLLLEHLRSAAYIGHKPFRFGACQSALYPQVVAQGVIACPHGSGAFFNGGDTGSSKFLEEHISRGSCRDRRPQAPPP
jgi:hypothetical protein